MIAGGPTDAAIRRQLSMITGGGGAVGSQQQAQATTVAAAGSGHWNGESGSGDGRLGDDVFSKTAAAATATAATATAIAHGNAKTVRDKQSLDYALRTGIAGGLAGCAAKTVVGPLDRVKILFQASSPQFAKYSGSWTGLITALREIGRIKFLAYEQIRYVIIPTKKQETPVRRLVSGSLAGLVSVFFTYPLEMIRVRLAFETKRDGMRGSFSRICREIYQEHPAQSSGRPSLSPSVAAAAGLNSNGGTAASLTAATVRATSQAADAVISQAGFVNFYRGFSPTLLGILPYAGVSFMVHDMMGDFLRNPRIQSLTTVRGTTDRDGRPRLTNVAELVSGAVAGLVGQTSAYPLEIIRRRMQVGGAIGDGHRMRITETAAKIWLERGWRGFFVGLGIGYSKVLPMVAVSFWTYEKCKQWLGV